MTRAEMLRRRLEQSYRASRFHSFLGSLQGVSDAEAAWTPPRYKGFPHMTGSILNLAYHTAGDKHVLVSTSFGDGSMTWERAGAWFAELGGDLSAVRQIAEAGHALVLETLDGLTDAELDAMRPYYGGKSYTAEEIFTIIAEHDLYHAGQINYVRCLYAAEKRAER